MLYEIYFSPTGGTKKVSNMICDAWGTEKKAIDLTTWGFSPEEIRFQREDICVIAVPSFGGRVPAPAVSALERMNGGDAKAILTAVYGNRDFDDTLLELKDTVKKAGFHCVAAIAAVAEHSIMRQFASGRPDESDQEELKLFVEKISRKLEETAENCSNDKDEELFVPGSFPYRKYDGVPMKPKTKNECIKCGVCATQCPVQAIPKSDPSKTDKERCISCMRCISVCPVNARQNNKMLVAAASLKMKKSCEQRKQNQLFL